MGLQNHRKEESHLDNPESGGSGGNTPCSGSLDIGGLWSQFWPEKLEESVSGCSWRGHLRRCFSEHCESLKKMEVKMVQILIFNSISKMF